MFKGLQINTYNTDRYLIDELQAWDWKNELMKVVITKEGVLRGIKEGD